MKIQFKLYYILVILCLASCKDYLDKKSFYMILNEYPNDRNYFAYLIIPKEPDCPCNSISYQLLGEIATLDYHGIRVFFQNESSVELSGKIPEKVFQDYNIVFSPRFNHDSLIQIIYPTIIYLKNNKIESIEEQNAKNPYALKNLKSKIKSKIYEK